MKKVLLTVLTALVTTNAHANTNTIYKYVPVDSINTATILTKVSKDRTETKKYIKDNDLNLGQKDQPFKGEIISSNIIYANDGTMYVEIIGKFLNCKRKRVNKTRYYICQDKMIFKKTIYYQGK